MGGRQPTGLRDIFQVNSVGGSFIRAIDMGTDPPHGGVPGDLPAQSLQVDCREAPKAKEGWGLVVTTAVCSDGGGRV